MFALLYKYVILALFMLTINYLFLLFLPTMNKGKIAMMVVIVINIKSFLGIHFLREFNQEFSKINVPLWKKAVLRITTLMHCKG